MMCNIKQIAALLRDWDNILILTHKRPDGDTIGSGVALCGALKNIGKTAWMLDSEDATKRLREMIEGYVAPPDFVPDKVVAVDIADERLLPPNAQPYKGNIDLSIDHHISHTGFAQHNCVQDDKAACGEILYDLVMELGGMDQKVAEAIYVGVSTDTGCFVYSNTTANTHRVAANLIEQGIDMARLNKQYFRTKSLKSLKLESAILQNMEFYQDNTIAVASVSREMLAAIGATDEDTGDISNFAGQLEGVLHSVTVRETDHGECKVSLRTNSELLNASLVCQKLGGGGHIAAAGCLVKGTMRQAIDAVMAAIEEVQKG